MQNENNEIKQIINELKLKNITTEKNTDEKQTILTRYELECMMPDYVFDKLNETDRAKFEGAIVSFPDLEQEVAETQELFANLEQFDYKALVKDKTQYLPSRVVDRLEQQGKLYKEWQPNKRRLLGFAVLSVALFAFIYFNSSYFDVKQEATESLPVAAPEVAAVFTELEKELLAEEIAEDDFVEMLGYTTYYSDRIDNDLYSLFADIDANYYDIMYSDFDSYSEISSAISTVPNYDYDMLIQWANETDETVFQDLLDDMYNL